MPPLSELGGGLFVMSSTLFVMSSMPSSASLDHMFEQIYNVRTVFFFFFFYFTLIDVSDSWGEDSRIDPA